MIRFLAFFTSVFVLQILAFSLAEDGDREDAEVIRAVESGLEEPDNFNKVHSFIIGNSENAKWRMIPWHADLWEARVESLRQNKPLFVWAMNGDPLGCV